MKTLLIAIALLFIGCSDREIQNFKTRAEKLGKQVNTGCNHSSTSYACKQKMREIDSLDYIIVITD